MKIIADLHIHSRYSMAASPGITAAALESRAHVKGIGLLGTGDCTHPLWLKELRETLDDAEEGLYVLKSPAASMDPAARPRFMLTGEISAIYQKDGKTRKVHHLVLLPSFKAAAVFRSALAKRGNIETDGRPVLGIDSREVLALILDADSRSVLVPAHIWTPWFSVFGAKSGFDSLEACYGDLALFVPAIETGLSSNPPMNWALSALDRLSVISNSDAHSPEKIGREATIFDAELSFDGISGALRGTAGAVLATIEMFPQEGKYFCGGHRKCGVCAAPGAFPVKTVDARNICPVCGKPLTAGVLERVMSLADRPVNFRAGQLPLSAAEHPGGNRRPYYQTIPLKEILAEITGVSASSKKTGLLYDSLAAQAGSEFALLLDMSIEEIGALEGTRSAGFPPGTRRALAEAVSRIRRGEVSIIPGYDGVYGKISVKGRAADGNAAEA